MHDGTGSLKTHGNVKDTACENAHLRCVLRMSELFDTHLAKQGVIGVLDLRGSGVHTAEHAVGACSGEPDLLGTRRIQGIWLDPLDFLSARRRAGLSRLEYR